MADGKAWSVARLETVADVRRSRLELLLKVLAVDGAVERVQGGWRSTGQPWVYDADRYARVTRTREAEQRAMIAYARPVDEAECRMAFLQDGARRPDRRALRPVRRLRRRLVLRRRPGGGGRGGLRGARPARAWSSRPARSGPPAPTGSAST